MNFSHEERYHTQTFKVFHTLANVSWVFLGMTLHCAHDMLDIMVLNVPYRFMMIINLFKAIKVKTHNIHN